MLYFQQDEKQNMSKNIQNIVLTIGLLQTAFGATIPGLFNTGTDASNLALVGGNGTPELHYTIVGVGAAVTYLHPGYLADDPNSRWLSEAATGSFNAATRTFRLVFDLTGFNANTASLSGDWGGDNCGLVQLNGGPTSGTLPGTGSGCLNPAAYQTLTGFSFNSGFFAGLNTLDFIVTDSGAPGGVRVDNLSGTVNVTGVPEPATATLTVFGVGLVGLALARRRSAK